MKLYESAWIPRGHTASGAAPYFERPVDDESELICIKWLQLLWELPEDISAIKVIAHNRPSQTRVAVAISEPDHSIDGWVRVRNAERPRQQWWMVVGTLQLEAQKFAGETLFVELWYK